MAFAALIPFISAAAPYVLSALGGQSGGQAGMFQSGNMPPFLSGVSSASPLLRLISAGRLGNRGPRVRQQHQSRYDAWVRGCMSQGIGSAICTQAQVQRQLSLAGTLRGSPTYGAGFAQLERLVYGRGGGRFAGGCFGGAVRF